MTKLIQQCILHTNIITITLNLNYIFKHPVKKDEMGGTCSTNGAEAECI
jgi:hypothetical protein